MTSPDVWGSTQPPDLNFFPHTTSDNRLLALRILLQATYPPIESTT